MSHVAQCAHSTHSRSRVVVRTWMVATLLVAVGACSTADSAAQAGAGSASASGETTPPVPVTSIAATTSTSSTSTTSTTSTTTSTSTTTTLPVVNTEVLPDVIAAALLGPVPEGTPVGSAGGDRSALYANGCHVAWGTTVPKEECVFGDVTSDVVVVVTGDSHATAWFGAFDEAGKANQWKIVVVDKQGCPTADVTVYSAMDKSNPNVVYTACDEWRFNALVHIAGLHADLVVFPMLSRRGVVGHRGAAGLPAWGEGLGRSLDAVSAPGTKLLVIGDTPKTNGGNVAACVGGHRRDVAPCGNSRAAAVLAERQVVLADAAAAHHASFVDPSNWFCTDMFCPAVIASLVVYRDEHHLTDSFSRYRAPQIADAIRFALANNP